MESLKAEVEEYINELKKTQMETEEQKKQYVNLVLAQKQEIRDLGCVFKIKRTPRYKTIYDKFLFFLYKIKLYR